MKKTLKIAAAFVVVAAVLAICTLITPVQHAVAQAYGSFRDTGAGLVTTEPWCNEPAQMAGANGCAVFGTNTVTYSATPVFDCSKGLVQKITLTGNVSSSTWANCSAGQPIIMDICQDGTGSRTFAFPTATGAGKGTIAITASKCNIQEFVYDSQIPQAQPVASMVTGQ